jgi:hypothetical protein
MQCASIIPTSIVHRRCRLNSGLAKVAVSFSADTFVVKESSVLRINICGENRHLRQAAKRYAQCQETPYEHSTVQQFEIFCTIIDRKNN